MSEVKTRRWVCPDCGAGKLAPSRPRRDDVRRFCLPCSERTGRLVERVCPANDRAREASRERSRRKAIRRRASARKAREAATERARARENDLAPFKRFFERALRLSAWEVDLASRPPRVNWSRSGDGLARGRANGTRVFLRLGSTAASNLELILHELTHAALDRRRLRPEGEPRWHNSVFRRVLADAVSEVTGAELEPAVRTSLADRQAIAALAAWLETPGNALAAELETAPPVAPPPRRATAAERLDALVAADDRLARWWDEGADGYWVELAPGFELDGVHCVHEWSVRDVVAAVRLLEPCDCEECRAGPGR